MPEKRGVQATEEVKAEWSTAYKFYLRAPGDRFDKKKDRTARIDYVAQEMKLTRKQAKRRIRNYEAWQRNIKKGIVGPSRFETEVETAGQPYHVVLPQTESSIAPSIFCSRCSTNPGQPARWAGLSIFAILVIV